MNSTVAANFAVNGRLKVILIEFIKFSWVRIADQLIIMQCL